jgi:hypothetical protein
LKENGRHFLVVQAERAQARFDFEDAFLGVPFFDAAKHLQHGGEPGKRNRAAAGGARSDVERDFVLALLQASFDLVEQACLADALRSA